MKKLLMLSIIVFDLNTASAQGLSEWFQQKKTQTKYQLQQILALKVYTDYLGKGYSIIQNGTGLVYTIKQGDFSLHNNYFNSLVAVNSVIRRYSKVADIVAMQVQISKQTAVALRNFIKAKQFTQTEVNYLKNVLHNLLAACSTTLDELEQILLNKNREMKDDERMKAIDRLYADMQDKQLFSKVFCTSATSLLTQRSHEANELIVSKKINDLK